MPNNKRDPMPNVANDRHQDGWELRARYYFAERTLDVTRQRFYPDGRAWGFEVERYPLVSTEEALDVLCAIVYECSQPRLL